MTRAEFARRIDHTALRPETREKDIRRICDEAAEYGFGAVCVVPWFVMKTRDYLMDLEADIPVCTVIGFPNGAHLPEVKQLEARCALDDGALQLDMVMNLSAFKSGDRDAVTEEIEAVTEIVHDRGATLKLILETALLKDEEIRRACEVATEAGVDYIKTSTGFGPGGATVEAVRIIRECTPSEIRIKASGGIADFETANALLQAGADRIGASKSVAIIKGFA